MLGIDVLAAEHFVPIAGKRVGLFTHPAGVNRLGVSTVDVLRWAPNVKLVALFGPEHGIHGNYPAGDQTITDTIDPETGLPVYTLFGKRKRPTPAQLKMIDVLVIDLQDDGIRSYSYVTFMRYAIEACFENGVEVIVLDRPNPLGGLKVDGPPLDPQFMSDAGGYCVPYVHGLTIGELARMAAATPGMLKISEANRLRGKLTVIPMRGWNRSMRWPETGLTFVPTSPSIPDFSACVGCAMTGLGCQLSDFKGGIGLLYPFRGLSYPGKSTAIVLRELRKLRLPGLGFRKVSVPSANGQIAVGIYVEVTDWDDWQPTELNFYLMLLACKFNGTNPFAKATPAYELLFNKLTGSPAFFNALKRDGAGADVATFLSQWHRQDARFQETSKAFWLYR